MTISWSKAVRATMRDQSRCVCTIQGTSMFPTFQNGQKVMLCDCTFSTITVGECCAVLQNDRVILHRIVNKTKDSLILCGDNQIISTAFQSEDIIGKTRDTRTGIRKKWDVFFLPFTEKWPLLRRLSRALLYLNYSLCKKKGDTHEKEISESCYIHKKY